LRRQDSKSLSLSATINHESPRSPRLPASSKSDRIFLVTALCLAAAVFAIYWPTLTYQFILDDHRFTRDPRIQSSGYIWDYFANYVWAQFTGGPPSFYRPFFLLWLRLNFIVSALSPWGWHLLSIAKHAGVALLLGLLVDKLLRDRTAALLAAGLFALHPAQVESVAWVTVPDPLMSAGILAALLLYLRYVDKLAADNQAEESRPRKSKSKTTSSPGLWLAASAAACFAAMLAKETAVVSPAVIFALALIPRPSPIRTVKKKQREADAQASLRHVLQRTVPFLAATALYLLLRLNALSGKLGAATQHLPWSTVLLSWPGILWFYITTMLWPARSHAFADPILEQRFSLRGVLVPALVVACAIAILIAAIVWARGKARRELSDPQATGVEYALAIGVLLLILPLLPCLNLNALNPGDFLHGRYTYLPLAGLMIFASTGWLLSGKMRVPLLGAAAVIALLFTVLTISQEKQWRDDMTVFTTAHQLAPHNAPVAKNLADARVQAALQLADDGRCDQALPVYQQVTQQYPEDWYAWAAMGDCLVQLNNLPKAEEALHRAADLSRNPQVMEHWHDLRVHMGLPNPSQ